MLILDHLSQRFSVPGGSVQALAPVSLMVARGEFVSIVGPSGCGKTTLLHLIAGLVTPTQGTVSLEGVPIQKPQKQIGLVFQKSNLMPWRTVRENIALPLELDQVPMTERRDRADMVIARLGLKGFEDAFPSQLSGGMAGRVAIGRALIQQPQILLLDEPFGALDALTRESMQLELLRLWDSGELSMAIMVTHSITEAVFLADRVVVMSPRPGQIQAIIPVELPRPRHLEMVHSSAFGTLASQVRRHIEAH